MIEKTCENCQYCVVSWGRYPCKNCGNDYRHFRPIKQKYGLFKAIKSIYVDPPLPDVDDEEFDRLMALIREYAWLAARYDASDDLDLKSMWLDTIRPALMDRIEARARAAFGGES